MRPPIAAAVMVYLARCGGKPAADDTDNRKTFNLRESRAFCPAKH